VLTPGQVAYEAYRASLADDSIDVEETWEDLDESNRKAWEAAAAAVKAQ